MNQAIFYNGMQVSADVEPVVKRTKRFLMLAFYRAVSSIADPINYPKPEIGSIEKVFVDFLDEQIKRNPRKRADILRLAAKGMQFEKQILNHAADNGNLAKVDLKDKKGLHKQLGKKLYDDLDKLAPVFVSKQVQQSKAMRNATTITTSAEVSPAPTTGSVHTFAIKNYLNTILGARSSVFDVGALTRMPPTSTPVTNYFELRLNFVKVTCVDKMDWEFTDFGDDDIRMGGKAIDTAGTQINVNQFTVYQFNRNNQSFNFNKRPRKFASFDLNRIGPWPRYFHATLAMAEKDADGGFIEFLQKIWEALDEVVIKALADAILVALGAAGIGAATGAIVGAEAAGIGAIVGAVVGAAVGFVVALVMESLKDDIFEPTDVSIILANQTLGFDGHGSRTSPTYQTEFNRDGARYILHYNWTLQ